MSQMFTLSSNDAVKGLVSAVFAAVVITLYGVVSQGNFDLFSAPWLEIGKDALNAAFAAFVGYLGKNFFTDSNGKVFGAI